MDSKFRLTVCVGHRLKVRRTKPSILRNFSINMKFIIIFLSNLIELSLFIKFLFRIRQLFILSILASAGLIEFERGRTKMRFIEVPNVGLLTSEVW